MRSIDPYSVHLFVSAVKQGSLGRAAERGTYRLFRSQPENRAALSASLGRRCPSCPSVGLNSPRVAALVFDRSTKIEGYLEASRARRAVAIKTSLRNRAAVRKWLMDCRLPP